MLRKLHNIFIKIGTLCYVLSFNITYVLRLSAKREMCLHVAMYVKSSMIK